MDSQSSNLPVRVARMGGAVATVLSWPQHVELLTRPQMFVIGDIIKRFPELNTEEAVDALAELAGNYKISLGRWFDELVILHNFETVNCAVICLHELALRSPDDTDDITQTLLRDMLAFFDDLSSAGYATTEATKVIGLIEKLGGWDAAIELTVGRIKVILNS